MRRIIVSLKVPLKSDYLFGITIEDDQLKFIDSISIRFNGSQYDLDLHQYIDIQCVQQNYKDFIDIKDTIVYTYKSHKMYTFCKIGVIPVRNFLTGGHPILEIVYNEYSGSLNKINYVECFVDSSLIDSLTHGSDFILQNK